MTGWKTSSLVMAVAVVAACNQSDFETDPHQQDPDGPGTPQWGEENVSCTIDDDCNFGEQCEAGVCQMRRCVDQPYASHAPLGAKHRFFLDRELAVADTTPYGGNYWADTYAPGGNTVLYADEGSQSSTGRIVDVAGGDFTGARPEAIAMAIDGQSAVVMPALGKRLSLGFVPVAIAAGDLDGDRREELIALGADGQVGVCQVELDRCDRYNLPSGSDGIDATAGDLDGDGLDEAIFHADLPTGDALVAWKMGADGSAPQVIQGQSPALLAIGAGDLDGDGRAEIVGLQDGGWLGWGTDRLLTFGYTSQLAQRGTLDIEDGALDLTVDDLDRDKREEAVVLAGDKRALVFRGSGTSLSPSFASSFAASTTPARITSLDFDGDSPEARLVGEPELIAGKPVPTAVLNFPPYYDSLDNGRSWVWLGQQQSSIETTTKSVNLTAGVMLGASAGIPEVLSAELEVSVERAVTTGRGFSSSVTVGKTYWLEANPKLYRPDSAGVIVSCGCYHGYTYEVDDPSGNGSGERFQILLPVGGQVLAWSSPRYNAMARAVGDLPIIEVNHRVGDPSSYPTEFLGSDGQPIAEEDLVFREQPLVTATDVGEVWWNLTAAESEINSTARSVGIGFENTVTLGPGMVGLNWQTSQEQGYELEIGSEFEIGGAIPAIVDLPETPEDEYATHIFGFRTAVYREHYQRSDGSEGAYYVVNYAVGR